MQMNEGMGVRSRFISEPIQPITGTTNILNMAQGEPALAKRFVWRDEEYIITEVLETWRETGSCSHGSGEQYVRKHWYMVRTACGAEMKIYFERKARSTRQRRHRWWLHSLLIPDEMPIAYGENE